MHPSNFINAFFLCLINAFFMLAGISLNSVVILSLWRSSQLRKKLCYFTIFILSCFDLTAVTIIHPVVIMSTIFWSKESYSKEIEMTRTYISIIFGGFSMLALLTLNCERFLALTFPFFHQSRVTRSRLVLFQVILMVILVSLSPFIQLNGESFLNRLVTAFVVFNSCVFIYLNYKMFIIAKSKRSEEKSTRVSSVAGTNQQESIKRELNFKKISTCSLAVSCFVICSFPPAVYTASRFASKTPSYDKRIWLIHIWTNTFVCMNSTLDCLIFFWRNSILRREGMNTAKRL